MSCEKQTTVFSAGLDGNPSSIPDGVLADAADVLVSGKRYVGVDATDDDGILHSIMKDCGVGCQGEGQVWSADLDGRLFGSAPISSAVLGVCGGCSMIMPTQLRLTGFGNPCGASNWLGSHNGQTLEFPMQGCFHGLTFGGGGFIGVLVRLISPGTPPDGHVEAGDLVFQTAYWSEGTVDRWNILFRNVYIFGACVPVGALIGSWDWSSPDLVYHTGAGPSLPQPTCWGTVELIS